LEEDAMTAFSLSNNIPKDTYKNLIENKYIEIIKSTISSNDLIIVLSNNYENKVIEFLSKNNYNFVISRKMYFHRENNAIHDLLFYRYCNHKFIGVYESSFSYSIMYNIFKINPPGFQSIIFRLNEFDLPPKVFTRETSIKEIQLG